MTGIFGDQHMSDRGFGRRARLDQACRDWSLYDTISAGAAGVFGPAGNDDAELCRDHIQPLGDILADSERRLVVRGLETRLRGAASASSSAWAAAMAVSKSPSARSN